VENLPTATGFGLQLWLSTGLYSMVVFIECTARNLVICDDTALETEVEVNSKSEMVIRRI
jgi:hypothetical protein